LHVREKKEEKNGTSFMCEDDWCMIGVDDRVQSEREKDILLLLQKNNNNNNNAFFIPTQRKARRDNFF
jgi:hypothetical protein